MATQMVPRPTGADVATILGQEDNPSYVSGLAAICAANAFDAVAAYTRGNGCDYDLDLLAQRLYGVCLQRAVRMATNYAQLVSESRDGVSMNYGMGGQGFLLQELLVLDGFRRTAVSI